MEQQQQTQQQHQLHLQQQPEGVLELQPQIIVSNPSIDQPISQQALIQVQQQILPTSIAASPTTTTTTATALSAQLVAQQSQN